MIYKLLISILAGCAVALTLTFCLLKKVRVKQIRYTQGTVVLGLPISLLAFLLQTSLAVPVVVVTAILSLLVIALELTLRHLVSSA